jgi:ATP-dependent Lon protease
MSKTKLLNLDMMSLQNIDEDSDLIPLMTSDDEEAILKESLPESLPILPLKNTVMFPGVVIPITASRDKSIKLIKDSNTKEKLIGVVSQKDSKVQTPTLNDIHSTGTVAKILRVLQMPDGNVTVIIQGKKRFSIEKVISEEPYITADIKEIKEIKPKADNKEFNATIESIKDIALQIIEENPNIPSEASFAIKNIQSDSFLVNFV